MSEFRKPSSAEIDPRYVNIVKNPEQRSTALKLAVKASVPFWEMARIDVEAQLVKQASIHDEIVLAYTQAQKTGNEADANTHERHLARILEIADGFYGEDLDLVEEVSARQEAPQRILAYSADD